jgi:hypothetical protein
MFFGVFQEADPDLALGKLGLGIQQQSVKSSVADPGCLSRISDPDF